MPRSNVTAEQKLDAVKKILSGEESRRHIRQIYGVAHSSVEEWILKYQIKGEKAFSDKFQKVEYSKEVLGVLTPFEKHEEFLKVA